MGIHVFIHQDTRYAHVSAHHDTVSKRDRSSCVMQLVSTHVSLACHIDMGGYRPVFCK
jgi:BioD-like phosphotransacetylase family protein